MAALERTLASLLAQLEGCRAALHRELPSDFHTAHAGTVVVSMLASGADTLGARAALALGFELHAVLPFPRERYRLDFPEAEEQDEFSRLCAAATRLLSVSGPAGEPDATAYERGGFLLVAAADVVVAIWDGEEARGRGGTAAVVQCALDSGRPVLTIHPEAPDQIALIWPDMIIEQAETTRATDAPRCPALPLLLAVVRSVLAPPLDESATDLRDLLLGRRRLKRWVRIEYPVLLALIGIRQFRRSDLRLPDAEEQAERDWAALSSGLNPAASGQASSARLTTPHRGRGPFRKLLCTGMARQFRIALRLRSRALRRLRRGGRAEPDMADIPVHDRGGSQRLCAAGRLAGGQMGMAGALAEVPVSGGEAQADADCPFSGGRAGPRRLPLRGSGALGGLVRPSHCAGPRDSGTLV
jgi:hypothetical protein